MGEQEQAQVLPDRVTMGLLPYINAHALDEDYAQAAARRDPASGNGSRSVGRTGAVVLAIFAVLAVTAAVQTSKDSVTEEKERRDLVAQVKDRRSIVDAERKTIARLRTQTRSLENSLLSNTRSSRGLLEEVTRLRLRSGIGPAVGPGVQILADDAPDAESDRNRVLDSDLQKIVNGLWEAGAEAISINGERLTTLSAIRHAGSAITVNFRSLERPYRILAIGDPNRMPTRFQDSSTGSAWLDLVNEVGLVYSMTTKSRMRLPGADLPALRFVNQEKPEELGPERKGTP